MTNEHDRLEAQYIAAKARLRARERAELLDALEVALAILDEHEIICPERDRCEAIAVKYAASAIEARRVETEGLDAKHESAVPEGQTPKRGPND